MHDCKHNRTPLAAGVAIALGLSSLAPAHAQNSDDVIEEVVVMGIRSSLASSMGMKRDAQGVSDGIVAEDIGKFPDTNLAESLQRITGVSIDRTAIGEGSKVTVRGVGPDFNLVTLNGRQMPGSNLEDTIASNSRSYDFANLASESVSAVEVYKTSQARLPTGGIGAVVDIRTGRPLDMPDTVFSIGAKAVTDSSVQNGDDWTPELSGIFSKKFADGKFGVAVTGSYQDRNLGYNQVGASSGFLSYTGSDVNWGTIPMPGDPNFDLITNRPDTDDVYSVPQNMLYSFNDIQRERTNGQLTLQFAPTDRITATLDYTYSELEVQTQRAELSAWFNYANNAPQSYTDGPLAGPVVYSEDFLNGDVGNGAAQFGTKNENESIGFNIEWALTDRLGLEFDAHNSTAESGSASPYGTNSTVGVVGFYRGLTTVDLSQDLPILGLGLTNGQTGLNPSLAEVSGSSFRNGLTKSEISQYHLSGDFEFNDSFSLDFGVMSTNVENRTAFSTVQNNDWGAGITEPDDFDDSSFWVDPKTPASYFSNVSGSSNPLFFDQLLRWDWESVLSDAEAAFGAPLFAASDDFTTDRRTTEETVSAYVQFNAHFEIGDRAANLAAGLRYEKTDVTSSALVPIPTGVIWSGANEFDIPLGEGQFTELKGDYDYVLPSIDFNVELTDSVIMRLGYSQTIGRPGWADIQGGRSIDALARQNGGTGNEGNPALSPLESTNIDVSFEWYYGDTNYISVAYFTKDIDNYLTREFVTDTPFDLPTPWGGARWQEAADATGSSDAGLIRDYIFQNYGDTPEVNVTGTDVNGLLVGTIAGIVGQDPEMEFTINRPANGGSESIDGWEIAIQHMFGDTGFGLNANYTDVSSSSSYDNFDLGPQFVLTGISDSANFVGFWENDRWSVRAAYNWRDEYLNATSGGNNYQNPYYVEAYGQWDANISFLATDNLSITLEGINITDEYTRVHGRNENVAFFTTNTGPRYMIGARYKFN